MPMQFRGPGKVYPDSWHDNGHLLQFPHSSLHFLCLCHCSSRNNTEDKFIHLTTDSHRIRKPSIIFPPRIYLCLTSSFANIITIFYSTYNFSTTSSNINHINFISICIQFPLLGFRPTFFKGSVHINKNRVFILRTRILPSFRLHETLLLLNTQSTFAVMVLTPTYKYRRTCHHLVDSHHLLHSLFLLHFLHVLHRYLLSDYL